MPPAIRPQHPRRQRLKRTQWRELDKRLANERDAFSIPLNDLGFEERNTRVRILMQAAYRMGRHDQRDVEKLRRAR